jgi:hypothetical protein
MEDAAMTHSTINNAKKTSFQLEEINDYQETRNNNNNNNNNNSIKKTNKNSLKKFSVELKDFDSSTATNTSYIYSNINKNIEDIGVIESKIMSNKSQNNNSNGTPVASRPPNSIITVSEVNNLKQSNKNLADSSNVSNNTNTTELSKTGSEDGSKPAKKPIRVTSRIVFLKVGQIDTRNERYDAEAYIEASWEDEKIYKILADPNMTKTSTIIFILFSIIFLGFHLFKCFFFNLK